MDNPDQRRDVSASEQTAKVDREREHSSRQVKHYRDGRHYRDERYYGDDRSAAQERKRTRKREKKKEKRRRAKSNAQHYTSNPQNFHHQIPPRYIQHQPPERFERNQFSRQIDNRPNTTRYDYDSRNRDDGYTTRRQNYIQSSSRSADSRRDHYFRSSNYDKRRSLSPQRHYNHYNNRSNNRICDPLRRYNDSSPPIHHRTFPESPRPTISIKEPIKHQQINTQFLSEPPRPTISIKEPIKHQQINTQFASLSYLDMADVSSVCLEDPPKKLLVLDLNGTLVYRDNGKRDIILRPYMNKFMQYIFESNSFAVMVWSSAQPINVDRMVRAAFGRYEKKLLAKWTRKHFNLSDRDYNQKVETVKDLEKVWQELNNSNNNSTTLPQIVWDQTNTVLIDDSCVKAKLQPYNAIHLPDFDNERCKSNNDHELHYVIDYLRKLHKQSNVSAYIKEYPYTPNDSQKIFTPKSRDHSKNNNKKEQERNNNCSPS